MFKKKETNKTKANTPKSQKKKKGVKIPKTTQQTIPYIYAYQNGIFEIEDGVFSRSYALEDINFKIASQDDQNQIFIAFGDFLNSFNNNATLQITIFNRDIDMEEFKKKILMRLRGESLDEYREEYNDMLLEKITEGRNNLRRDKYLTISIEADDIDAAVSTFNRMDSEIKSNIKKITGRKDTRVLTLLERLTILYEIISDKRAPFYQTANLGKGEAETINFKWMKQQNLTTKDLICPSYMKFHKDYVELGEKIGKLYYINNLPSFLTTDMLADVCDIPCNAVTSVYYQPLRQDKSMKMVRNQMTNINANIVESQKKANRSGYSQDLISPSLKKAKDDAEKLIQDMTSRNQKMFSVTIVVMLLGESLEEVDKYEETLDTIVSKHLCPINKFTYAQEAAFSTVLPLCNNKVYTDRLLTTENASVFIPFVTEEMLQPGGVYYGINSVTNNLILYNRLESKNANGVILGTPGSGKSFAAKQEIINVVLNTDDEILIIDPEGEYSPLAKMFGGEVIKISSGSKVHINPLDMDMNYANEGDDPVTLKSDFIASLFETISRARFGLTPNEVSIIDRCTKNIYVDYIEHMQTYEGGTCDRKASPVLEDLYEELMKQPDPEAQSLATSLELYAIGSQDIFAKRTNVNLDNRFIVYDIKDIGSSMKNMGLQVCLNDVWNRVIENKSKGKRTWFYVDEMHILTQADTSAKFLQSIYKRARKWGGIPTGMTQNVEDLLKSAEARTILNNCDFVLMLNQAPLDRNELAAMYNISDAQCEYVTNADSGQGILYTGKTIVPFTNKFPTNTKLYKAMTTKVGEVSLIKEKQEEA